jgi:hypothetical protein
MLSPFEKRQRRASPPHAGQNPQKYPYGILPTPVTVVMHPGSHKAGLRKTTSQAQNAFGVVELAVAIRMLALTSPGSRPLDKWMRSTRQADAMTVADLAAVDGAS